MTKSVPRRRDFLEECIARGLLVAAVPTAATSLSAAWLAAESAALKPTPNEVLGPFYKKNAPNSRNLRVKGDPGMPLRVAGRVVNTRGEAVPGVRIDLWHADAKGIYDVQGYRYRSKLMIEAEKEYSLETIMPGHYPDRPAQHIHYLITAPGHKSLITQLYFATDPFFEGNVEKNYGKRGIVSHRESVRPVTLFDEGAAARAEVTFDLILEKA